jgi:NAD(P)-dependent dehydrogenase (short-subunit alcohol dehydrogenase family)
VDVAGKVVIVTGGANGIGKALCERFHKEGARKVIVVDLEPDNARSVADTVDGDAFGVDEVVSALAAEQFLILPHKEVAQYRVKKTDDYDRWLGGMRKLRRTMGHPQI